MGTMAEKMLKFVTVHRAAPKKREPAARLRDFDEIYPVQPSEQAAAQAARCSQCGVPFCQSHCPLTNNIPDWLKLAAEGRLEEAYEFSAATNPMPEICGRICPQDRLCEGACVIEQAGHGTVTIGAIEKYITDTAFARGWVTPIAVGPEKNQSVGIIGSGPAGLAAAEALRKTGYRVTVYERADRAGGLMIYGIPNFKLDKALVIRRVQRLIDAGVQFSLNCEVGKTVSFADLRRRHSAVFLATGAAKGRGLELPGANLKKIVPALDYLTAAGRHGLGERLPATLSAKNKDVVVIGGGDTAMDALRTALRQGAKSAVCLYRRDRTNMPGSRREVANAQEEGAIFHWLSTPRTFTGISAVDGIIATRMRLGPPDATGRKRPEEIPGSEFTLPADLVILALGFMPEDLPTQFASPELAVDGDGTLQVQETETALAGVFAGGDAVRGPSLAVWAIKDGLQAANAIDRYLQNKARASRAAE